MKVVSNEMTAYPLDYFPESHLQTNINDVCRN